MCVLEVLQSQDFLMPQSYVYNIGMMMYSSIAEDVPFSDVFYSFYSFFS
jgi:hypothetical protein